MALTPCGIGLRPFLGFFLKKMKKFDMVAIEKFSRKNEDKISNSELQTCYVPQMRMFKIPIQGKGLLENAYFTLYGVFHVVYSTVWTVERVLRVRSTQESLSGSWSTVHQVQCYELLSIQCSELMIIGT